jgi:glycine/D-amino acid oxidase-like deaminating enzyme
MYDYLIIGFGVAGFSLMQQLEENRRNFLVFDNQSQQSTRIAGGMFNPVILKRFTPAWQAGEMLPYALLQFQKAGLKYQKNYIHYIDIYRKLTGVEEQNNWTVASDKPVMRDYMNGIVNKKIPGIEAPYGFGVLRGTGIVNVAQLLDDAISVLKSRNLIRRETFDYKALKINNDFVEYKDIKAKKIVFAEGFGLKNNPFFKDLPLMGTKGEMLMIETDVDIPYIVKSNVFIAPNVARKGQYYVGATYNWNDKTNTPSLEARQHLENKLQQLFTKKYKVVLQKAGIRPTVIDRRPLVGIHPLYKQLGILNGMGTRGVILAPTAAKQLFMKMEFDMQVMPEMDIKRFENKK